MWAADIDMAQGRFAQALATATTVVDEQSGRRDTVAAADAARLAHLAHRFQFQFEPARRWLDEARPLYAADANVVGLANVATNALEQDSFTDPRAGLDAFEETLVEQESLGALHEVGKIHTAAARCHLLVGDLDAVGRCLTAALDQLELAGDRSGAARAHLLHVPRLL